MQNKYALKDQFALIDAERERRRRLTPAQRDWENACMMFEGLADAPLDPPCRDPEQVKRVMYALINYPK